MDYRLALRKIIIPSFCKMFIQKGWRWFIGKDAYYYCKRHGFSSQCPHKATHNSCDSVARYLMLNSGLHRYLHTHSTHKIMWAHNEYKDYICVCVCVCKHTNVCMFVCIKYTPVNESFFNSRPPYHPWILIFAYNPEISRIYGL